MDRAAPMSAEGAAPLRTADPPVDPGADGDRSAATPRAEVAPGPRIPFDHLDKVCFVAQNRELGVSFAPVWQLVVHGDFDPAIARRVITALIQRYPTVVARAVSIDGDKPVVQARKLAYQVDPTATADQLFDSIDLSDATEAERREFQRLRFDHHVDLETDFPLHFTWARTGPDRGILFLQQHHGIADGKAFFELLETFCRLYDQAARGPLEPVVAIAKLDEETVAEPRRWRRRLHRYLGYWYHFRMSLGALFLPMGQLFSNLGRDYTGSNTVTHRYFDTSLLDRLRALRARTECSVNDFLTAALAISLFRWSDARGARPRRFTMLIPADARPRGFTADSFANHLCSYVVLIRANLIERPADLLRDIHRQMARQSRRRYHTKALLAGIRLVRLLTVDALRKMIYTARKTGLNFSFSNLISISPSANQGRFATASWRAERLEIMTPCGFLQGINTTVIRYGEKLCFNFNFKDSCVDAASVDELIERFRDALDEVTAAVDES